MSKDKIRIESVRFSHSESSIIEALAGRRFSLETANALIDAAAADNETAAYFKTQFVIMFEDGQTYNGRIDIYSAKTVPEQELCDHVKAYLGHAIESASVERANEAEDFLNTYDLG